MDTNAVPSAVTDAVAHAPASWQPWILAGISLFPFFTRFIYGLYSQRGIVGAVHGLLFGTNEVKQSADSSTATGSKNMPLALFLCLGALSAFLFFGCGKATLESGGAYAPAGTNVVDTAVAAGFYNTDLSYKVAWSAINIVFEFEKNNRDYLWKLDPKIKHTLDSIRPKAVEANAKYLAARQAYLDTPDQPGLDILHTVLVDLQRIVGSVQVVLPAAALQTKYI